MKNRLLALCFICPFFIVAKAQVKDVSALLKSPKSIAPDSAKNWNFGGMVEINFAQASFTNWSAGGENSVTINNLINLHANYRKNKNTWDNVLDLGYGFISQTDGKIIKTDDKIDLSTKYGRMATKSLYYTAMLNFKTQFSSGYDYPNDSDVISNFLSPGYLVAAAGIDYKPTRKLTIFLAPITDKTTIVNSPTMSARGDFGVHPGDVFRSEFGCFSKLVYKNDFLDKTLSLRTKLELFSNYLNNPENVDLHWENSIGFKINKYFSVNINTELLYDDDIKTEADTDGNGTLETHGAKIQFKEILGLGLHYKF